eukprot:gene12712-biopygen1934
MVRGPGTFLFLHLNVPLLPLVVGRSARLSPSTPGCGGVPSVKGRGDSRCSTANSRCSGEGVPTCHAKFHQRRWISARVEGERLYPVVTSGLAGSRSFQRRPRYPGTPNERARAYGGKPARIR